MNRSTPCPDMQDLQRFSLGQDDDAAGNQIEDHLSGCSRCVATLERLDASDELVEAAHGYVPRIDPPLRTVRIANLIERLKALGGPTTPVPATPAESCDRFLAAPQNAEEIGRLGSYRVLQVLGSGGMGVVYLAEDTRLQRLVALKVLRPTLAEDVRTRQRFLQEARAMAAVASEHIVPIYEVSEDRGLPFLAMPVLHGETLADRLAREGRLPAEEVVRIGRELAQGLAAAHRHALIHRDIKPANIWLESPAEGNPLGSAGRVKLLDFGLVQVIGDQRGLTEYGTILGTPEYMAPEQASGEAVDARNDLFSLGSVLYATASGRPPFHGKNSLAVLRSVCEDTPPPLRELAPDMPDYLVALIEKLHAKDRTQRCQSAREVLDWLEQGPNRTGSPRRHVSRRRWVQATALLLLVIGGLTAWAAHFAGREHLTSELLALPSEGDTTEASLAPGNERNEKPQAAAADEDQPQPGQAQPAAVPLAILPFEERGVGVKDLGVQVSDLLFARLSTKDDLILVDRADLTKTLKELELGLSGAVRKESAPRVGQLTGARLLLSGSVLQADKRRYLIAKLVSVETGRIVGVTVDAPASGELAALVTQLSDKVADKLAHPPEEMLPRPEKKADRLAALRRQLGKDKRLVLWVHIKESAALRPAPDPAAQTEVIHLAKALDFEVVDAEEGAKGKAQILITGEGLSETASRHEGLVTAKARLEVKAVDRVSGKIIAMERQTTLVVDTTEQLAGKAALQQAAEAIAHRLLPKLVKR